MNRTRPLTPQQALNRAAALCSRSEQAAQDIRGKLTGWGLSPTDADAVLRQLVEQGFIDNERFARAFVNDKFTFNGWGRIKIAHQLRQKGIPSPTIEQAMTAIDDEQYHQRLMSLLHSKWHTVKSRDPRLAWAALMRFAVSRGFEATLAAECVKQVTDIDAQDD